MKRKKIAFFIPSLDSGGAERVVSNLTLNLDSSKYEKYLIVYNKKNISYKYDANLIELDYLNDNGRGYKRITKFIKRLHVLKNIKREYKFDIVISFLQGANILNILTRQDEKVFISIRNYIDKSYNNIEKILSKVLYRKADLVICVSNLIKENMNINYKVPKDKLKVIYNPYDIELINELAQEEVEDEYIDIFNKPTIINVGRVTYQKGQWYLLRAFSELKSKIEDVNLIILGNGDLIIDLKAMAKELEIEDNVFFLDFQENPYKFIKRSDVFVLSSLYEGFPNALVEAMACGLPIISTDCKSGPNEILVKDDNNIGILIDVFDGVKNLKNLSVSKNEKILAEKIENILTNTELKNKYAKMSSERVKDFKVNSIINEWEKIIGASRNDCTYS